MHSRTRKNRVFGFTIIEALVTAVLVSVAVVGVMGAVRAVLASQAKSQTDDLLVRLDAEKIEDLKLLANPSDGGSNGDYSDRGYPNITWSLNDEATSVPNLSEITVTSTDGNETQALETMIYTAPATTTGTTGTTGTGAGTGTGGTAP